MLTWRLCVQAFNSFNALSQLLWLWAWLGFTLFTLQAGACPFQRGHWCGGCEARSCGGGTTASMCFQELKMLVAWGVYPSYITCILQTSIWVQCAIVSHGKDVHLTEGGVLQNLPCCTLIPACLGRSKMNFMRGCPSWQRRACPFQTFFKPYTVFCGRVLFRHAHGQNFLSPTSSQCALADSWKLGKQTVLPKEELRLLTNLRILRPAHWESHKLD